jgi:hypothetical protein
MSGFGGGVRITVEPIIRFWAKVEFSPGCWVWRGAQVRGGYGSFFDGYKSCRAHRYSYTEEFGAIPKGLYIDHLCRNRLCVRPEHLRAVTRGENLRASPDFSGNRLVCRTCMDPLERLFSTSAARGCRRCTTARSRINNIRFEARRRLAKKGAK